MTEQVTIAERYRRATHSSNLKVESRRTGDPDLLIAAGWADSLGIKLYRLAGEFDQVLQDMRRASTQTDAIMVLGHLKTLNQARIALVRFAIESAPRWGVTLDQNIIGIVAGKALSAWLDPNCPRCGGTGSLGGYNGKTKRICPKCGGTGKSRHGLGDTSEERNLAHRLMAAMECRMHEADAIMKRYMKGR